MSHTFSPSGASATVRIDRPKVNAISNKLAVELYEKAIDLSSNRSLRSVVFWGGADFFAAGADIKEFPKDQGRRDPWFIADLNAAFNAVAAMPQVTIAAVNGPALGAGCELCLAADFRFCGETASFGLPEIKLGLIPGAGGTQRLPRLVGLTVAKEMVFLGRSINAIEAKAVGLVSEVFADDALLEQACEFAGQFDNSPASTALAKRAIDLGLDLALAPGLALEADLFDQSLQTNDALAGIEHFTSGKASDTARFENN